MSLASLRKRFPSLSSLGGGVSNLLLFLYVQWNIDSCNNFERKLTQQTVGTLIYSTERAYLSDFLKKIMYEWINTVCIVEARQKINYF